MLFSVHAVQDIPVSIGGDGSPSKGEIGQSAHDLQLLDPSGVAVDPNQNVFIADTGNDQVVMVPFKSGVMCGRKVVRGVSYEWSAGSRFADVIREPSEVAVNARDDLAVVDSSDSALWIMPCHSERVGGRYVSSGTLAEIAGAPPSAVAGVNRGEAIDPEALSVSAASFGLMNQVVIADGGLGSLAEIDLSSGLCHIVESASGLSATSDPSAIALTMENPSALAVDKSGDIAVASGEADAVVLWPNVAANGSGSLCVRSNQ